MIVTHRPVDVDEVARRVEDVVDRIDAKLDELAEVLADLQDTGDGGDQ